MSVPSNVKKNEGNPLDGKDARTSDALSQFREHTAAIEPLMRTICHGLNNHLTRLLMHTEMANMFLMEANTTKIAERLKVVQDEIETVSHLVRGFRLIGRNGVRDGTAEVALHPMLKNIEQFSADQLKSRSIFMDLNGVDPTHKMVGKESDLAQAIYEIIKNAIDQCDTPGHAWQETRLTFCSTLDEQKNLLLSIIDSGPAIAEPILDKIWQPFFTTKAAANHRGIGLTVARELIEGQGGSIQLETVLGVNRFIIKLCSVKG